MTAPRPAADQEGIQFEFEHSRLYDALEHAAQIAEIVAHGPLALALRDERRAVATEIARGFCDQGRHEVPDGR